MRDDHVEFFKQFLEDSKLKSESAVCTPISDTLTIEMLERAYIVAHSMRPAAVYTEHCNFMRINMIRLGAENLPGTHYDSRVGMGMVHCIAWRYHYKLVYGQLQKSELLQYRDESKTQKHMILPPVCKYWTRSFIVGWMQAGVTSLATDLFYLIFRKCVPTLMRPGTTVTIL